jgi:hypothetical protein
MPHLLTEFFGVYSDGYVDLTDTGLWTLSNNSMQVSSGLGPYGESILSLRGSASAEAKRDVRSFGATKDIAIAFWFASNSGVAYDASADLLQIFDVNSRGIRFRSQADGTIHIGMVAIGASVTATSVWQIPSTEDESWHHLEFYMKVSSDPSQGLVKCWLDGTNVISTGPVRTLVTSNDTAWKTIIFRNINSINAGQTVAIKLANIIVWCGSDEIVSPIGLHRMQAISPSSAGTTTQFTASSGTNFESVGRVQGYNKDARYVETINSGNLDTYQYTDAVSVGAPNNIIGITLQTYARNTDIGIKNFADVVVSSGTTQNGSATLLTNAFQRFDHFKRFDPATSSYWTQASVNSAEFGVRAL